MEGKFLVSVNYINHDKDYVETDEEELHGLIESWLATKYEKIDKETVYKIVTELLQQNYGVTHMANDIFFGTENTIS